MKDYIIKKDVPILDEHVLYDEEGKELAKIDEARLKKIAALANTRIQETGDECPIVIGHTKDDTPEEEQPEIVGYASHFRVARFLKTGRKAITATFKFFKKYADKIKKYPRRSIELWLNDWKIDPISLLGATTPERDLGLLRLSKNGSRKYKIVYQKHKESQMGMGGEQKAIVDAVMKAIQESDWYKFLCEKMKQEGEGEEGEETPGESMDQEDSDMEDEDGAFGMGEDEELGDEQEASQDMEEPVEEDEEAGAEPVRYGMGSTPSGSNAFTPNGAKKKMMQQAKMRKDQERGRLHRYEKQIQVQNRKIRDLQVRFQREQREKDLIQLEMEGLDFDRVEELEDVMDLPEEKYQRHLDKMRRRYSKTPVGDFSDQTESVFNHSRVPKTPSFERKAISAQAVDLASTKNISFEQALAELEG